MIAEVWALVGVAVGATLGGGAQIVADPIRAKRDRRQWINEHRRQVYLDILGAIEELNGRLWSGRLRGHDPQDPEATSGSSNAAYFEARHSVAFYGSPEILRLVDEVETAVLGDSYFATYEEDIEPIKVVMRQVVGRKVDALSLAMRRELGIVAGK